jgi:hypothetical protein
LFGIKVISPFKIKDYNYDKIVVGTIMYESVVEKLEKELFIPSKKIDISYVNNSPICNRNKFLSCFSKIVYDRNNSGSVAEGGVFMGDFAKYINKLFPDRTMYLFDTFEGFDKRDIELEHEKGYSEYNAGHLMVSPEYEIKSILPHPEKVIIHKGYFPDTAKGIDDTFVFVNLDFDLYKPTLAGLDFFYQKMVYGGVIIIHDYFSDTYKGVKKAVDEFCDKNGVSCIPIADEMSVAIAKYKS